MDPISILSHYWSEPRCSPWEAKQNEQEVLKVDFKQNQAALILNFLLGLQKKPLHNFSEAKYTWSLPLGLCSEKDMYLSLRVLKHAQATQTQMPLPWQCTLTF